MRRRGSAPAAPVLSWAVLHLAATGEYLDGAEGRRRYGDSFKVLDALKVNPDTWPALYRRHGAEIEAHARALGRARAWAGERVEHDGTTNSGRTQ